MRCGWNGGGQLRHENLWICVACGAHYSRVWQDLSTISEEKFNEHWLGFLVSATQPSGGSLPECDSRYRICHNLRLPESLPIDGPGTTLPDWTLHYETYLPTFQDPPRPHARVSGAHEDPWRPCRDQRASCQRPQTARRLTTVASDGRVLPLGRQA